MTGITLTEVKSLEQKLMGKGPYVSIFREVLDHAMSVGASDIHIQPYKDGVMIFIRVDGDRTLYKKLDVVHRQSFITEAKRLSNFSIAIKGKTQDARAHYPSRKLDTRGNIYPTPYDDKIVLRLCDNSQKIILEKCGFDSATFNSLKELTTLKNGLILISGPTGSGKTSTLYGLVDEIDRIKKCVLTIENPIEKDLEYVTQGQIQEGKLTFASALKAAMRQDPDVILVGEIRDHETAEIALEAAGTGHLVISTIHANDPIDVLTRLDDLKVSPLKIKSYLRFSGAQRLLKKLCPNCKIEITREEKDKFMKWLKLNNFKSCKNTVFYTVNEKGCDNCNKAGKLGTKGRVPIMASLNSELLKKYYENNYILGNEYKTLKQHALDKAEAGIVCIREVMEIE